MDKHSRLHEEIEVFHKSKVWKNGFRTGYNNKRNQKKIEEYLAEKLEGKNFVVLEIGCGGGQWSKFLHKYVAKLYCVDVLSAEYNNFWNYVGHEKNDKITYYQVNDFTLSDIPENSVDFVFSYDVFCHISEIGVFEYLKNLYPKVKNGSELMIMYADPQKYLTNEPEHLQHYINTLPKNGNYENKTQEELIQFALDDRNGNVNNYHNKPRWFFIGIDNFIKGCETYNYSIIERDLDIDKTNPITLFKK